MESARGPAYSYAVDERDVLVSLNDAWIEFALENEAPELTPGAIVGRPIWDFVAGAEVQSLYRRLFARVRAEDAPRSVPFRCDSPELYRFMELRLLPTDGRGIELEGVLVREQPRVYCPVLDRRFPKWDYSFAGCSVCNRIFAFGSWLETDEAVRRLRAFESNPAPAIDHTICESCRTLLDKESTCCSPS